MATSIATVYEALLASASTYRLPDEWGWLDVAADCLRLEDADGTLATLRESIPDEDLLASHICTLNGDQLVLHRGLADAEGGFVVCRDKDGLPFDLVTAQGSVRGACPFSSMISDRNVVSTIMNSRTEAIYVVGDLADAVLFRSLGLQAVIVGQLAQMPTGELGRLTKFVGEITHKRDYPEGWVGEGPANNSVRDCSALVLFVGTLHSLTAGVSPEITAALRHLKTFEEVDDDIEWDGVTVCILPEQELERMTYMRRFQAANTVKKALTTCHRLSIDQYLRSPPPPPGSMTPAETYLDLLNSASRRPGEDDATGAYRVSKSRPKYNAFCDQTILKPLLEEALDTGSPEDKARLTHMFHLARIWQRAMPAIYGTLSESQKNLDGGAEQILPTDVFKQLVTLSSEITKSAAAISRSRARGGFL